jgi:hypothetical protein
MKLIDQYLPQADYAKAYATIVNAPAPKVFAAIKNLDLGRSLPVRILVMLRGLPVQAMQWRNLHKMRFTVLGERPNEEVVAGLIGKFWTARGHLVRFDANEFVPFSAPGFAKTVWNFTLEPAPGNATLLATETRILCLGPGTRRKFARYWFFIAPFSGFLRREALRLIKRDAERDA